MLLIIVECESVRVSHVMGVSSIFKMRLLRCTVVGLLETACLIRSLRLAFECSCCCIVFVHCISLCCCSCMSLVRIVTAFLADVDVRVSNRRSLHSARRLLRLYGCLY